MKRIEEQTYYEILEVSPGASMKEIQRAYEHAKQTFDADSVAVYSLFSEDEMERIRVAVDDAYRALMDEASRKGQDVSEKREPPPEIRGTVSKETFEIHPLPPKDILPDLGGGHYRGKDLRKIREKMGIDLMAISAETKISPKILNAIEEETVGKLPPLVYLKGFLKAYARSLGLDPSKVIEGYLTELKEPRKK